MKRWIAIAIYFITFTLAFTYKEDLAALINDQPSIWSLFALSILFALVPIMPYRIVIAAAGYITGTWTGGMITLIGSTIAGALFYWGSAYGFREPALRWIGSLKTLERVTQFINKRPFAAIIVCRLIPVLPQTAVNIYAGVAGIPFMTYLLASIIGKFPSIFLYAYLGNSILSEPITALGVTAVYLLFLAIVLWIYKRVRRDQRQ
ncbi:putative membrane protein YdjX (TVP38/TMEM64 family) [Paenibacillus anaericanus]|uniref:TVP38/TMEM64 family protein n=1 Tax=Paenibacillus anaericanus TaxID=170367 RepID=UPI00277E24FC|nr:VTT domain-containing protein [Paenibacillus anaericanus]MDQ0088270.1 putative membrane protein YdjX (TVP38/TMEM64 family) [Paenibacillus anaericanus]